MGFFDLFGMRDKDTLPEQDIYRAPAHLVDPDCHLITPEMENKPYSCLEWEGRKSRYHHTFDDSLRRLRKAGYDRHPRPQEIFSLTRDFLHNRLNENFAQVAKNLLFGSGEWSSMAMKREGNLLYCCLDPENLGWDKDRYVVRGRKLKGVETKVFDVGNILSRTPFGLDALPDELVQYITGWSLQNLPSFMHERFWKFRFLVTLPIEGDWSPVGKVNLDYMHVPAIDMISRGVKER